MDFTITRKIEIDAGHRIASHGSKCRHLHGHRYVVEVTCKSPSGRLVEAGEQAGMILDFGFLKDELIRHIDAPCDHGLIVALNDHDLLALFLPKGETLKKWTASMAADIKTQGYAERNDGQMGQKLYVIPVPPTAECLARHWFERLTPAISKRSGGNAQVAQVRVWETPNCWADYGLDDVAP